MQIEPTIPELTLISNRLKDDIKLVNFGLDRIEANLKQIDTTIHDLRLEFVYHKAANTADHNYFERANQNTLDVTQDLLNITKAQQKQIQIYKYWLCALTTATAALLLITPL